MLSIGIDQSLSSTGISIVRDGQLLKSYLVSNKPPKKKFSTIEDTVGDWFEVIQYDYTVSGDEIIKTRNVINCADAIMEIVKKYTPLYPVSVTLEGIAFSSRNTSRLDELSALNYLIRERLLQRDIPFRVITPSANKKAFTGNGCATKELMTESFLKLNPEFEALRGYVKLDDIADSFALATYN